MNDKARLAGFIHVYEEGTEKEYWSIWNVEILEEDRKRIDDILSKYDTVGISVSANKEDLSLVDAF